MNSRESTYCRDPQYKDRNTREEDYYDDRWEERQEPNHDKPRDDFRRYGGAAQSSMERSGGDGEYSDNPGGDGEYSDNPRRVFIEKKLNSDQSGRSPLKRPSDSLGGVSPEKYTDRQYPRFDDEEIVRKQRQLQMIEEEIARKKSAIKLLSSETERYISEKKRRRFTEDVDDVKYGQSPDDSEYGQSSDHMYREKDFPCRQPPKDNLSYKKTSRGSKHRNQPEDFSYKQRSDDSSYRKSPAHYKERHFQDCSNDEDTQSDQFYSRVDAIPRERDYSPPSEYENHRQNSSRYERKTSYEKVDAKPREREISPSSDYEDHRRNSSRYERNTSYERVDAKPRERDYSPSSDYEDHRRNSSRYERNRSYERGFEDELDVTGQDPGARSHNAAAKGFERFLGLLNKGVNVDKLLKIVGQSPALADDPPCPQSPRLNAEKPLWSDRTASQQEQRPNKLDWSEDQGSPSEVPQKGSGSQLPRQNTYSFQECSQPDESLNKRLEKAEGSLVSARPKSPRLVEKMPVRPVEGQKSRQMQDLLQVIGMDLGFEELGQMSSRIQERLYGKKDDFEKRDIDLRWEKDSRVSSRHHSRSLSSSRSSFGPLTQNVSQKNESMEIAKDIREAKQQTCSNESRRIPIQDNDKNGNKSLNCSPPDYSKPLPMPPDYSKPPPMPPYNSMSKPPPPPVMPPFHSMSTPPPTPVTPAYPPPPFLPYTYSTATPAMPPAPTWGIGSPFPFVPGSIYPYQSVPTSNTYQAPSGQVNYPSTSQTTIHRQLIDLSSNKSNSTQNQTSVQFVNTIQKSKTSSRPRCLQVIEMGKKTKTD